MHLSADASAQMGAEGALRAAGVDEYVLIGTLGSGTGCYVSLNDTAPDGGYSRHLLEDVSAELLDAHAVPRDPRAPTPPAALCAVSFRRDAAG